jgi:hypothetical protein
MLSFSKEQIQEISEQLDCGFRAFYHKQKTNIIFVPDANRHIDMETDAWQEDLDELDRNFLEYQEIYSMEAKDSFSVMTDFIDQLADRVIQEKLYNALNKNKPFREFKIIIDNSGEHRQKWFDFKNKRYFDWTEEQLKQRL